jgi:hypothetical protein
MKMKNRGLVGLSVFLFAAMVGGFFPTNAHALACEGFFATAPIVCGDAIVQGSSTPDNLVASPNPVFTEQSGGPVAVGAFGSGSGGISGAAAATGSFGEAHISASADNGQFKTPAGFNGIQANVSAQGEIGFIDGFSITGPALDVQITNAIDGVFTGQGFAQITFLFDDITTNQLLIDTLFLANGSQPSFSVVTDLLLAPGDYVFSWALEARADSANDVAFVLPSSTADVSHTGHLFFDSADGPLTFLSGHDYSSAAVVPVTSVPAPAALPLFATGLGVVGLLARRRKRKNAAAIAA